MEARPDQSNHGSGEVGHSRVVRAITDARSEGFYSSPMRGREPRRIKIYGSDQSTTRVYAQMMAAQRAERERARRRSSSRSWTDADVETAARPPRVALHGSLAALCAIVTSTVTMLRGRSRRESTPLPAVPLHQA